MPHNIVLAIHARRINRLLSMIQWVQNRKPPRRERRPYVTQF